ncbi:MAG: hypothetical protein KAH17_06865 [Bacteroidales bacterium]|nr:hypothetical protein [Bacteroidales bacterium]
MNIIPDIESTTPWLPANKTGMPEQMKNDILMNLSKVTQGQIKKPKPLRLIINLASAACLLLFLVYSFEQYNTLNKISQLETRIAEITGDSPVQLRTQNELLIINSFVSWSEISSLRLSPTDPSIENQLLPSYLKANLFGDRELKEKFSKYLREFQLATKIYIP